MPDKSYTLDGKVLDIPEKHVEGFLKKHPTAVEVESFTLGEDTLDIPLEHVEGFKAKHPKAEPLKKKDSAGAGLSEPLGTSNKAIRAEDIIPKKQVSGVTALDPAEKLVGEVTDIPEVEAPPAPEFEPVENLIQKTLQESQNVQSRVVSTVDPERMREQEGELRRRFAESEQANKAVLTATPQDVELPGLKEQRKELEENPSYFWGTVKAVNEGTASFFRTLDNAATTIEDLTGMKKGGGFGVIADYIDEGAAKLPGTPDNIVGDALQDLGHLEGMFLELAITPEFKIARLAQATGGFVTGIPKLSTQMGASGFLNTYGELTDLNVDQQEKVLESFAAMGHGGKEGALLSVLGFGSGKAAQAVAKATESGVAAWATGVGVNAGGFGGLTAVEQLISEGNIDPDAVRRSTVLGAALGLPGLPNALFGRAFGNYGTASPKAKALASNIKVPLEEMREKSADLREQAEKADKPDVKEDLLTQADVIDNLADIKAVTEDVRRDPGRYLEAIEKDENMTPQEKSYYPDQINETVAKLDPKLKEAQPIAESLEKVESDLRALDGNDLISNSVKAAKKQSLLEEKVRLTQNLTDVFRGKEEPPVPEPIEKVEVPKEPVVKPGITKPEQAELESLRSTKKEFEESIEKGESTAEESKEAMEAFDVRIKELEAKEKPAEEAPKPEPTPEEERTTKINRLLDLKQSFNKLTTAERTKDTEARERIIKLASELEVTVEGTDKIDIKTDGKSLGRPKEALEEEFVALKGRSEKTQSFVKDVTELGKKAPETIMGIGMGKARIEQAIRNIEEGKDTKAAREFVDIMDNFVEQGYVEIRVGKGIDAQWFRMELDEFTGKAEAKEELRPEDLSDEVIESNEDLNRLISAVGNKDGSINYVKLEKEIETRPELIEPLTEGLNETEIADLKTRIHEQAEKERRGVEPTPEVIEERKRLIKDLEDKAGRAKTAEEYRAVLEEAERLEAEPLAEPEVKPEKPPVEPEPKPEEVPDIPEGLQDLAQRARKAKSVEEFIQDGHTVPIETIADPGIRETIIKKLGKIESRTPEAAIVVEISPEGKLEIRDGAQRYYQKIDAGAKTIDIRFTPEQEKQNIEFFEKATKVKEKPEEEPKIAEELRKAAEFVRSGKVSKPGQFKASTGFDIVWDGSLEAIAKSLEAGADLAVALDKGLKHIQASDWYKDLSKPRQVEFDGVFEESIREQLPKEKARSEKEKEAKSFVEEFDKQTKEKTQKPLKRLLTKINEKFFDDKAYAKQQLEKAGAKEAVWKKNLTRGAGAESKARTEEMIRETFGTPFKNKLTPEQKSNLNKIILFRRTIVLDKYKDGLKEELAGLKKELGEIGISEKRENEIRVRIEQIQKSGTERLKHTVLTIEGKEVALTKELAETWLNDLKKTNPKDYEKLNERANQYFTNNKELLKDRLNEELIDQETFDRLVIFDYSKRMYLEKMMDTELMRDGGFYTDTEIRSLKQGSEELLFDNAEFLLQQNIASTTRLIFENRANKALGKFVKENETDFAKSQKSIGVDKTTGQPIYSKAPTGWQEITYKEGGETKSIIATTEFFKSWSAKDPIIKQSAAQAIQWVTGTKPLKFFATGVNPFFSLYNFVRDPGHVYFFTDAYSIFLPKAAMQMGKDLFTVAKDAWTRKGRTREYTREGGMMDFLTTQGVSKTALPKTKTGAAVNVAIDVASKLNHTSETIVRLSIRERQIKDLTEEFVKKNNREPSAEEKKEIQFQATAKARAVMDYSEKGEWIRAADNFFPYLAARFQGLNVAARAFRQRPLETSARLAQGMGLIVGATLYNLQWNDEDEKNGVLGYNHVPDYIKSIGEPLMLPFTTTNKRGEEVRPYLIIPIPHEFSIFKTVAESTTEWAATGEFKGKPITKGLKMSIPYTSPADIPIVDAIVAYEIGYDRFRDKQIWKNSKLKSEAEFTARTPEIYKDIGKATGLSPDRMKLAAGKIFTNHEGNIYSIAISSGYEAVKNSFETDQEKKQFNDMAAKAIEDGFTPLQRRFYRYPSKSEKAKDLIEEKVIEENTRRKLEEKDKTYQFIDDYRKADRTEKKAIEKEVRIFAQEMERKGTGARNRIMNVFNKSKKTTTIESRFIIDLMYVQIPEVKARIFFEIWREKDEQTKKMLISDVIKAGIFTERFIREFYKLNALEKKYVKK